MEDYAKKATIVSMTSVYLIKLAYKIKNVRKDINVLKELASQKAASFVLHIITVIH